MQKETLTVTEYTRYIKNVLESDFLLKTCFVKGEVSNCKYHSSGHIYFTLKDSGAQVPCVMFAGRRTGISFTLKDGQSVIVGGTTGLYEPQGKYQIYAEVIRLDGEGSLFEEYERLKKKLSAEGLFDSAHKKPIPKYVKTVGIVTASTGAAIQDICQISKRRNPYVQLVLYPAKVQGEGSAESVVRGIRALDGKVDVIIVGRGGGSIEDLWAFNEEITARAIYECETPIVSAVGHETDTTIADFVSDLRAPTPSAGAELCVFQLNDLEQRLALCHEDLAALMMQRIEASRTTVERKGLRLQRLSPKNQLIMKRQKAENNAKRLKKAMDNVLLGKKQKVSLAAGKLEALSPVKRLESGFSYVSTLQDKTVTKVSQVKTGDKINVQVTDGIIRASVEGINECEKGYGRSES